MTNVQARAGLAVIKAVADAVRELGRVPSGNIYAVVMGSLSLEQYERVLGILKDAGLIEETAGHELIWIEPK